ncbi:MAG: hypothetical protein B0A82_19110 [Alkalinema sp. CACIAM 70d]|nr:MAG: hypothetical protein B0A82_19110 [Alkalinema sp. CACIAM 70d]
MALESTVTKRYVEQRDQGYWIEGTRISLDSIVYAFRSGASPEIIRQSFPLLALEQVYGAIAFYLANQAEIDAYLEAEERAFDAMPQPLQATDSALYGKLMAAKAAKQQVES